MYYSKYDNPVPDSVYEPIPDCECGVSEEECEGDCYAHSLVQHPNWN